MKNYMFLVLMMNFYKMSVAQEIQLEVSTLIIKEYQYVESNKISVSERQGPFITLICNIINQTAHSITIYPSTARFYLTYSHDSEIYRKQLFPLAFMDNERVQILPGKQVEFEVDERIFIGTPIYSTEKKDYLIDLTKSLPTLELIYKDRIQQLTTKMVKNVIIK